MSLVLAPGFAASCSFQTVIEHLSGGSIGGLA
jgi:hypothetical protein